MPQTYVKNLERLVSKLKARAARMAKDTRTVCKVGYTAPYAVYVHEDLTMRHPRGGQAKFLEAPCRLLASQLGHMIAADLANGRTVGQALLRAGTTLQRAAQKLTPVDTGFLIRSAFTRLERP